VKDTICGGLDMVDILTQQLRLGISIHHFIAIDKMLEQLLRLQNQAISRLSKPFTPIFCYIIVHWSWNHFQTA